MVRCAVLSTMTHMHPILQKKRTQSNMTLRRLQAHGPNDLTVKIKVWFMILEEPHFSKLEHFRGSSVTADEMLPGFIAVWNFATVWPYGKIPPDQIRSDKLSGVWLLKCVGIKKLCIPFRLCVTSFVGHD